MTAGFSAEEDAEEDSDTWLEEDDAPFGMSITGAWVKGGKVVTAGGALEAAGGAPPYVSSGCVGGITVGASVGMLTTGEPVKTGKPVKEALIPDDV